MFGPVVNGCQSGRQGGIAVVVERVGGTVREIIALFGSDWLPEVAAEREGRSDER